MKMINKTNNLLRFGKENDPRRLSLLEFKVIFLGEKSFTQRGSILLKEKQKRDEEALRMWSQ